MAKRLIEDIISNETIKAASKVGQAPTTVHEMMIPGNLVARVIGKGGEVIKALQEETGARVVIIQVRREETNSVLITPSGQQGVRHREAHEDQWHRRGGGLGQAEGGADPVI